MTAPKRPYGSMKSPAGMHMTVESAAKERFDAIAARSGVSNAMFFELMVKHLELDEFGLPVWLAAERPAEELPIDPQ